MVDEVRITVFYMENTYKHVGGCRNENAYKIHGVRDSKIQNTLWLLGNSYK